MKINELKIGQYIRVTGKIIGTSSEEISVKFPGKNGGAIYMKEDCLRLSEAELAEVFPTCTPEFAKALTEASTELRGAINAFSCLLNRTASETDITDKWSKFKRWLDAHTYQE